MHLVELGSPPHRRMMRSDRVLAVCTSIGCRITTAALLLTRASCTATISPCSLRCRYKFYRTTNGTIQLASMTTNLSNEYIQFTPHHRHRRIMCVFFRAPNKQAPNYTIHMILFSSSSINVWIAFMC